MNVTANQTDTRKQPVAGIGFGQRGYWGNRHFSTVELAEAAFDDCARETRAIYTRMGKFIEEEITGDSLIRGLRFVPLRKDGKRGKLIHTIHLYRIEPLNAELYLRDRFYSVEE
jgi:hypothetical protein